MKWVGAGGIAICLVALLSARSCTRGDDDSLSEVAPSREEAPDAEPLVQKDSLAQHRVSRRVQLGRTIRIVDELGKPVRHAIVSFAEVERAPSLESLLFCDETVEAQSSVIADELGLLSVPEAIGVPFVTWLTGARFGFSRNLGSLPQTIVALESSYLLVRVVDLLGAPVPAVQVDVKGFQSGACGIGVTGIDGLCHFKNLKVALTLDLESNWQFSTLDASRSLSLENWPSSGSVTLTLADVGSVEVRVVSPGGDVIHAPVSFSLSHPAIGIRVKEALLGVVRFDGVPIGETLEVYAIGDPDLPRPSRFSGPEKGGDVVTVDVVAKTDFPVVIKFEVWARGELLRNEQVYFEYCVPSLQSTASAGYTLETDGDGKISRSFWLVPQESCPAYFLVQTLDEEADGAAFGIKPPLQPGIYDLGAISLGPPQALCAGAVRSATDGNGIAGAELYGSVTGSGDYSCSCHYSFCHGCVLESTADAIGAYELRGWVQEGNLINVFARHGGNVTGYGESVVQGSEGIDIDLAVSAVRKATQGRIVAGEGVPLNQCTVVLQTNRGDLCSSVSAEGVFEFSSVWEPIGIQVYLTSDQSPIYVSNRITPSEGFTLGLIDLSDMIHVLNLKLASSSSPAFLVSGLFKSAGTTDGSSEEIPCDARFGVFSSGDLIVAASKPVVDLLIMLGGESHVLRGARSGDVITLP